MILGIKMTPTLVEKVIKNMIDFWIAPGRALDGLWVGAGLFATPATDRAEAVGRGKGRGLIAIIILAKRARRQAGGSTRPRQEASADYIRTHLNPAGLLPTGVRKTL